MENEKLKAKAANIEAETANKYWGIIDRLNETLDAVMHKCNALEKRVSMLEAENDRIRNQLGNDSNNSFNPPSSDTKPNAPNTYNGRTKMGKKFGEHTLVSVGRKGKHLSKESVEEKIAAGQYKRQIVNHGKPNEEYVSKFVIYIKVEAIAVEHRFYGDANSKNTHHYWSDDMKTLLLEMKNSKAIAIAFGATRFEESGLDGYRKRFDEIVSAFYKTEEKRLLNRLKKYRENHLLFAADFAVPFDNNLSERDLRIVKTKGKVSGCFRSLQGAKIFVNLMSITKTAVKQGVSPFVAVKGVFAGGVRFA